MRLRIKKKKNVEAEIDVDLPLYLSSLGDRWDAELRISPKEENESYFPYVEITEWRNFDEVIEYEISIGKLFADPVGAKLDADTFYFESSEAAFDDGR